MQKKSCVIADFNHIRTMFIHTFLYIGHLWDIMGNHGLFFPRMVFYVVCKSSKGIWIV
jgi:hypothetical protein